ncbi:hypothetical protein QIG13_27670, partial [Klebsiella pneumoniae]|nr:hypothetical protein [Klebsiella pneumoniae]
QVRLRNVPMTAIDGMRERLAEKLVHTQHVARSRRRELPQFVRVPLSFISAFVRAHSPQGLGALFIPLRGFLYVF